MASATVTPPESCEAMISFNQRSAGEHAVRLCKLLGESGIPTFCTGVYCPAHPGCDWRKATEIGMVTCKILIMLMTQGWQESGECQVESNMAYDDWVQGQKKLLPVIFSDFDPQLDMWAKRLKTIQRIAADSPEWQSQVVASVQRTLRAEAEDEPPPGADAAPHTKLGGGHKYRIRIVRMPGYEGMSGWWLGAQQYWSSDKRSGESTFASLHQDTDADPDTYRAIWELQPAGDGGKYRITLVHMPGYEGMSGWALGAQQYWSSDKRSGESTFASVHKATHADLDMYRAIWALQPAGDGGKYRITLVHMPGYESMSGWALGAQRYWSSDKRSGESTYASVHKDTHADPDMYRAIWELQPVGSM